MRYRSGAMIAALIVIALPHTAAAYVGPGAGLSLLGALWGLLLAIGAAFALIAIWPLRRLMRRRAVRAAAERGAAVDVRTTQPPSREIADPPRSNPAR